MFLKYLKHFALAYASKGICIENVPIKETENACQHGFVLIKIAHMITFCTMEALEFALRIDFVMY